MIEIIVLGFALYGFIKFAEWLKEKIFKGDKG